MENLKGKILIGPHHGERSFDGIRKYDFDNHIKITEIGYCIPSTDTLEEGDIHKETLLALRDTHQTAPLFWNEDFNWGQFTTIEWDFTTIEKENMQFHEYDQFLDYISIEYIDAHIHASGDDETFDYMPGFCDALESILKILKQDELIERIRHAC